MAAQAHGPGAGAATALLLQFITWSLIVSIGLILANLAAFITFRQPFYLIAIAAGSLLALALALGWQRTRSGQPSQAVLLVSAALLASTVLSTMVDQGARPLLGVLPLLAATLALPFVSGAPLARLLAAACLVSVGSALLVEMSPAAVAAPPWLASPFRIVALAVTEGVLAILLWQLSRWLHDTFGRLEATTEDLRVSRANMQALVDNSPDIIVRLDRTLRHVYVNPALERATGLPPAAFLGKTSGEAGIPGALVAQWEQAYREVLATGCERVLEYELDREGGVRLYEARVVPERDATGETGSLLVVSRDLTDRRKTEEQRRLLEAELRNRQKLESLSVLTGGVAHDFNNLLGIILGNSELALMDLEPDSPARAAVEPIADAARRAGALTRQMSSFAGRRRAMMQPLDLNRVLNDTEPLLRAALPPTVQLDYHHACYLPEIQADEAQLRQVLLHLVVNASEAISQSAPAAEGTISVSTGMMRLSRADLEQTLLAPELPEGEYVVLEVGDSGAGMDDETRERIFEPFFTTRFVGRGLGLPAVLGIVQAHRGAIRVCSAPGEGTVFTVLLPTTSHRRARGAGPAAALSLTLEELSREVSGRPH